MALKSKKSGMITMNTLSSNDDLLKKLKEVPFKKKNVKTGHPSTYADDLRLLHELQVQQLELEMHEEQMRADLFSLEELKKKHLELFEFAPNGYFSLSYTGNIRKVNMTGANLLGSKKSDITHQLFLNYIHQDDQNIFRVCWFNLIETRDYQVFKVRLSRPDGNQLYVRIALTLAESKNDSQILLAMTDVTMVRQIENAQTFLLGCSWAKSGNDFFHALAQYLSINLSMDCVTIDKFLDGTMEAQNVAVYCDGHFKENVKYELKETVISQMMDQKSFCFPNEVRKLFPHDGNLNHTGAESFTGVTLWGSEGKPIGLIGVIGRKPLMDARLTEMVLKQVSIRAAAELEHRQLEETIIQSRDELEVLVKERTAELEKSNAKLRDEIFIRQKHEHSLVIAEEKYRMVADFTYNWETWMNPRGAFVYVSPSCERISGYMVEEFMHNPELFIQITHPDDRERVRNHFSNEITDDSSVWSFDFRINTRQGEERWIGHHCQPVFDAHGKFLGQRGSNRDITQRKKAEIVLLDSQKHLRKLTQRMDAIAEEERTRIAREIHDELGHLLTALKYDMDVLISQSDQSMESVKSEMGIMMGMVDSLIDSVRKIATELRPGILDHLGLFPAIEWQIRQFRMRTNICCSFSLSDMEITFDKNETTIIYRIFQEILTNITRHSKASHVKVFLSLNENYFELKVTDNGMGFEPHGSNQTKSLGLMGMQERALSIGGDLRIESAPGKGTTVIFLLPKVNVNYSKAEILTQQMQWNQKE